MAHVPDARQPFRGGAIICSENSSPPAMAFPLMAFAVFPVLAKEGCRAGDPERATRPPVGRIRCRRSWRSRCRKRGSGVSCSSISSSSSGSKNPSSRRRIDGYDTRSPMWAKLPSPSIIKAMGSEGNRKGSKRTGRPAPGMRGLSRACATCPKRPICHGKRFHGGEPAVPSAQAAPTTFSMTVPGRQFSQRTEERRTMPEP
jgi:hypothetical protein